MIVGKSQGSETCLAGNRTLHEKASIQGSNSRRKADLSKPNMSRYFAAVFFTVKKIVLTHRNLSLFEQRSISTISKRL